jgi:hypothetical protein
MVRDGVDALRVGATWLSDSVYGWASAAGSRRCCCSASPASQQRRAARGAVRVAARQRGHTGYGTRRVAIPACSRFYGGWVRVAAQVRAMPRTSGPEPAWLSSISVSSQRQAKSGAPQGVEVPSSFLYRPHLLSRGR